MTGHRILITLLLTALIYCQGALAQSQATLEAALQPLVDQAAAQQVRLGIGLQPLGDSHPILLGSSESFHPASTIKMLLITTLMQQVDAGQHDLEDTVAVSAADVVGGMGVLQHEAMPQPVSLRRLAELTVTVSDNTATNVLVDVVGYEAMAQLARQLELTVMHFGRKMFEPAHSPERDNFINTMDALTLLLAIHDGDLLSPASSAQILDWMSAQTVNSKFGAGIPASVHLAHKTGENGPVSHDMGYLLLPEGGVALVVLAESLRASDFDNAQALLNPLVAEVAATVYQALTE